MSEAENPDRLARAEQSHGVSVEDVRELMGASTPHFAPPDHPARLEGEHEIARLERLGLVGEVRGEGPHYDEPPLPSLDLAAAADPD